MIINSSWQRSENGIHEIEIMKDMQVFIMVRFVVNCLCRVKNKRLLRERTQACEKLGCWEDQL